MYFFLLQHNVAVNEDPLKGVSTDSLKRELDSVALDWKSLRNVSECQCSTNFDHIMKKVHYKLT